MIMGVLFATRNATVDELELFRKMMSTFRDGSGVEREEDGSTRAGWRQIERCVSALVNGIGGEDKGIFDVVAIDEIYKKTAYGFSVKSKQLSKNEFAKLASNGQTYMEIANSPAKFWAEIVTAHGCSEQDFRERKHAAKIGTTVIDTVEKWHREGAVDFELQNPGVKMDLTRSCYFCLSYSKASISDCRDYQIHIFRLEYPKKIKWKYKSSACLTGYVTDRNQNEIALVDWYGLSGGQLKYYPLTSNAIYSSPVFKLYRPVALEDLRARAKSTKFQ